MDVYFARYFVITLQKSERNEKEIPHIVTTIVTTRGKESLTGYSLCLFITYWPLFFYFFISSIYYFRKNGFYFLQR